MNLIIGNKNYSSWSLRPWLLMDAFNLPFEETLVSLAEPDLTGRLLQYSNSARVPVLVVDGNAIWDSLAICEYISESLLQGKAWPSKSMQRALARSVTAEMHSGFGALRNEMPMNCRASRTIEASAEALENVRRVDEIWSLYARPDHHGDLRLFGRFSIADCFFAPVVMRFLTYGVKLSSKAAAYRDSMRAHPSLEKWCAQAAGEAEIVADDETGVAR
ncbi:MAG: glutathione S-transferase [Cryomorphaceae bacterium]|jgi:glutathione S-transferase